MSTKVEQLLANKGRKVWSIQPETTVQQAVALFGIHDVGAVLVCDEQGCLIGVLSERDCVRKVMWQGRATQTSLVSEVMRTDVVAVSPNDTIEQCMALMTERRTRHLPVVERGEILGVISMGDVIHAMLHEKDWLIESLEGYISGSPSVRPPAH